MHAKHVPGSYFQAVESCSGNIADLKVLDIKLEAI